MSGYLRSVGVAGLGDLICIEGDCLQGETLITQMHAVYLVLAGLANPSASTAAAIVTPWITLSAPNPVTPLPDAKQAAFTAKYKPSVDAILKSRDALETWARRWTPFHPNCCAIRDLGGQAQAITKAMTAESGAAALPGVNVAMGSAPGPVQQAVSAIWDLAKLGALVYGGVWVWKTVQETPRRRATTRQA